MKSLISLTFLLLLTSCASKYISPTGVPLAKITYMSASTYYTNFFGVPTNIFIHENADCNFTQSVGVLEHKKDKTSIFSVDIPAGKILYNSYRTTTTGANEITFTYFATQFIPEEGREYEITVSPFGEAVVRDVSSLRNEIVESSVAKEHICKY